MGLGGATRLGFQRTTERFGDCATAAICSGENVGTRLAAQIVFRRNSQKAGLHLLHAVVFLIADDHVEDVVDAVRCFAFRQIVSRL